MRPIISKLKEQLSSGSAVVLVTLIATQGSTYRKPGARMLITEDGQFDGLVSGGCLEGDLVLHAKKVFFDRRSRIVEYDMRAEEEGAWGLALGCNGLVRLHLQYIGVDESSLVLDVCQYADHSHRPVVLISSLEEEALGAMATAIYVDNQYRSDQISEEHLGQNWQSIKSELVLETSIKTANTEGANANKVVQFNGADSKAYLVEIIQPQFHLLVLGAGPDAGPVCTLAQLAGWQVTLVDHRVAYVNKAKMLDADKVIRSEPKTLSENIELNAVDAALLMSHNLDADTDYFAALMETSIAYIGILGPKSRSEIIFGKQRDAVDESLRDRVHAPAGLDLGGEGPEAIAMSIIAEIQAHRYQRSVQSLRYKGTGIHDD